MEVSVFNALKCARKDIKRLRRDKANVKPGFGLRASQPDTMNVVKEMRRVCVIKQLVEKDISEAAQWADSEVTGKEIRQFF